MASSLPHQLENLTHSASPSVSVLGMANQQLSVSDLDHQHFGAAILHQAAATWSNYGYGNLKVNFCGSNAKFAAAPNNVINMKLPSARGSEGNLESRDLVDNVVKDDDNLYTSAFDNQLYADMGKGFSDIAWGHAFPCQEDFTNKVAKDFNNQTSLYSSIYNLHPAQRFSDHLLGHASWNTGVANQTQPMNQSVNAQSPPSNSPNSCKILNNDVGKSTRTDTTTITSAHSHPHLVKNSCLVIVEDTKPLFPSNIIEAAPSSDDSMNQEVSSGSRRNSPDTGLIAENSIKKRARDQPKDGPTLLSDAKDHEEKKKRQKIETGLKDDQKNIVEQSVNANSVESIPTAIGNPKPPEPPKSDYIHVRARRGQATDSHSLAERIRREKISERMKFLQDLVPGCSKVTGKAVMLDEIINYVQSLQQQVEFLSMKLAAINPRLDFNVESLLGREIFQPQTMLRSPCIFPKDSSGTYRTLHPPPPLPPLPPRQAQMPTGSSFPSVHSHSSDAELTRTINTSLVSAAPYGDSTSQISLAWEDELQSVVQRGFTKGNQPLIGTSTGSQGQLFAGEIKVEL